MAGKTYDALDPLPSAAPVLDTDYRLIGRGTTTYKHAMINAILDPMPILIGVTDGNAPADQRCQYTDDPTSWWEIARMPCYVNGTGSNWADLVYIPEMKQTFAVAALNNGGNKNVIASTRDGRNWSGRADDQTTINNGIAWSPSLSLIAVARASGSTTSNRILTSPDGNTWTERALPTVSISLNTIAWSPTLAMFVTMGASNAVFTSTDGTTWTSRTGPTGGGGWRRVIWCGGTRNKFVGFDGNNVGLSTDGINWGAAIATGITGNGRGLAFSPSLDVIVLTDANTNNLIVHSSNGGTTWTSHTVNGAWHDVAWSATLGKFIAVGGSRLLATSTDGASWTRFADSPVAATFSNWTRLIATK